MPELRSPRLLWCGIGGSLLPAQALLTALGSPLQRQQVHFLVSPERCEVELRQDDQIVFASKSGNTLELWTWIGRLQAHPAWGTLRYPPLVITQDDENPLAQWARQQGFSILPIPVNVGGRYSVFSPVGTLMLHWLRKDISAFLAGATHVRDQWQARQGEWFARIGVAQDAMSYGYLRGVKEWVILPYAERLETFGAWWAQLVGESLGKCMDKAHPRSIIPSRALGPMDQHSQLQRWLADPAHLGVAALSVVDTAAERLVLPPQCPYPGLEQWRGSDILATQCRCTLEALEALGVPVLHWSLPNLKEETLGQMFMAWQIIVALTGMALHVNPFDQPEVERVKQTTRDHLESSPVG